MRRARIAVPLRSAKDLAATRLAEELLWKLSAARKAEHSFMSSHPIPTSWPDEPARRTIEGRADDALARHTKRKVLSIAALVDAIWFTAHFDHRLRRSHHDGASLRDGWDAVKQTGREMVGRFMGKPLNLSSLEALPGFLILGALLTTGAAHAGWWVRTYHPRRWKRYARRAAAQQANPTPGAAPPEGQEAQQEPVRRSNTFASPGGAPDPPSPPQRGAELSDTSVDRVNAELVTAGRAFVAYLATVPEHREFALSFDPARLACHSAHRNDLTAYANAYADPRKGDWQLVGPYWGTTDAAAPPMGAARTDGIDHGW